MKIGYQSYKCKSICRMTYYVSGKSGGKPARFVPVIVPVFECSHDSSTARPDAPQTGAQEKNRVAPLGMTSGGGGGTQDRARYIVPLHRREAMKKEAGLKAAATQGKGKITGLKTGHYRRQETAVHAKHMGETGRRGRY